MGKQRYLKRWRDFFFFFKMHSCSEVVGFRFQTPHSSSWWHICCLLDGKEGGVTWRIRRAPEMKEPERCWHQLCSNVVSVTPFLPPWTLHSGWTSNFKGIMWAVTLCGGIGNNMWLRRWWLFLWTYCFGEPLTYFLFLFSIHDCIAVYWDNLVELYSFMHRSGFIKYF